MVWGMIGPNGGIAFCCIEGRMNSDAYIDTILYPYVFANESTGIKNKSVYFQ